ncbi:MAG: aminotransferase class I/II-fold pyridoxal phosphate-dependent enzyme [Nitrospiraceae bacterium]|nr:MAG: aminotransferase class I/II-fold pyridoxal phosphate-dependent enzyme [Nitrospiraceae bacterium]
MHSTSLTAKTRAALDALAPLQRILEETEWLRHSNDLSVCDFTLGNPHEAPIPAFVDALRRHVEPGNLWWYTYKMNEPESRAVVCKSLRRWRGVNFEEKDIFLTNGSTAALNVVLNVIIEQGDEVIFISPPWFQYEGMIMLAGGAPVRVKADMTTLDLDLNAIGGALTQRTRAIIVNSPHNPTGKIYPPETLKALAAMLTEASGRGGRPVYLISDEAYSRIIFDGRAYHSPTAFYPRSFLVYTYGKVLLTPGQRIGFIALPPEMPDREDMRRALYGFQMLAGWAFPNALLQHALADLDRISIDISRLQQRRDRLVSALQAMGYETNMPEGTFYVIVRSPIADDFVFVKMLAGYNIFCIPGSVMDIPGYFRLSLTADDGMVERALPGFAAALQEALRGRAR